MLLALGRSPCKRVFCPPVLRHVQWSSAAAQLRRGKRLRQQQEQSEHAKIAQATQSKKREDSVVPVSIFLSPSSEWKDHFRAQMHARLERTKHSPFVQRAYNRFVRTHPDLKHCGLAKRRPVARFRSPWLQQRRLPAFSYLKDRLHKKNRPQATARRNSLLRSRQHTQPLEVLLRSRARRRRPRLLQKPSYLSGQRPQPHAVGDAMAAAWTERRAPTRKPLVQRIRRSRGTRERVSTSGKSKQLSLE